MKPRKKSVLRGGCSARAPRKGPALRTRGVVELRDRSRIPRYSILHRHRRGGVLKDFSCQCVLCPHIGRWSRATGKAALTNDIGSIVTDGVVRDPNIQCIRARQPRNARDQLFILTIEALFPTG